MKEVSQNLERMLSRLSTFEPKPSTIVVMPDFFLDRFVSWNGTAEQFSRSIFEVATRKGGSIDNVAQMESRGGNAANTAAALAVLGLNVFPIISTSQLGFSMLKLHLRALDVDLSHVNVDGDASITTALEFAYGNERRNVMLRYLGTLDAFGPDSLTEKDYSLLKKSDYICVFNWAGTRRHGTELARTVFHYVKTNGRGKTYYDTADPLPNKSKIHELVKQVLLRPNLIDILSLNENEAITYARFVAPKQTVKLQRQQKSMTVLANACAKILAQKLTSRIDLHTTAYSATFTKNTQTIVPAFKVKALRATGAGDAWNAGNIYADANGFSDDMRLMFANAVAAYYLSSSKGEHPQLSQLRTFLQQTFNESH